MGKSDTLKHSISNTCGKDLTAFRTFYPLISQVSIESTRAQSFLAFLRKIMFKLLEVSAILLEGMPAILVSPEVESTDLNLTKSF